MRSVARLFAPIFRVPASAAVLAACFAATPAAALDDPQIKEFIRDVAARHDLDTLWLQEVFATVEVKQPILDAISRPAEKTKPWHEYREIFLTSKRIKAGVKFWGAHADALEALARETGVPAQTIVAILGVETFYGRITGGYRVIDALSTLAFRYPPRSQFFTKELEQFLLLTREAGVDALAATGSYAGAMGAPQFMPSSFRAYAVDANGDGRIDLWTDWDDVMASVANYFVRHGWQRGRPVVAPARGDVALPRDNRLELKHTVAGLRQRGLEFETSLDGDAAAMPVVLEGDDGEEIWVGFRNFYVITRYNRSVMYALAVHQLGEAVAARMQGTGRHGP